MKATARFFVIAAFVAVATWSGGWWTVPAVALAAGLLLSSPGLVAAACAAGWLVLLLLDMTTGSIGRLGSILSGVMGLPAPALVAVTLAFPALLGWSAATLGNALRRRPERSEGPALR